MIALATNGGDEAPAAALDAGVCVAADHHLAPAAASGDIHCIVHRIGFRDSSIFIPGHARINKSTPLGCASVYVPSHSLGIGNTEFLCLRGILCLVGQGFTLGINGKGRLVIVIWFEALAPFAIVSIQFLLAEIAQEHIAGGIADGRSRTVIQNHGIFQFFSIGGELTNLFPVVRVIIIQANNEFRDALRKKFRHANAFSFIVALIGAACLHDSMHHFMGNGAIQIALIGSSFKACIAVHIIFVDIPI